MNYQEMKAKVRQMAIDWQYDDANTDLSYFELAEAGELFYRLGKRYGLLTEFRENGII
jgi:hypothetical protein